MHFSLNYPFACVKSLDVFELPEFAVLIGKNGVGKTRLLSGIQDGSIAVSGLPREDIEFFNFTSFRSGDSGKASWKASEFHRQVVERYFTPSAGSPLVEVAERIFQKTLDRFELSHDVERRREFIEAIRGKIHSLPDFQILGTYGGDDAVTSYSQALQQQVLKPLDSGSQKGLTVGNRLPIGVGNNPATLVSLAMKLGRKLPHELDRGDFLRASNYEGGTITNQLSPLFTRYKVDQCHWALTEAEESHKSFRELMGEYRQAERPPWETLRAVLDQMRDASTDPELFNFEFSDPEQDSLNYRNHQDYSFTTTFTNRSTGESYPTRELSSGESIRLSMCFAAFHKAMGRRQPGLVLLDEVDAVLHPSMISALVAGLKEQFVDNGTQVIMATHSVTTVSLVDDDAIFRVSRSGGHVDVAKVTKSEAVADLSEGLATIDAGLKIAARESAAPITIMSEGNNALHLKRWAALFFPGKVDVFDKMPSATGKDQLAAYARLLGLMATNSHFLFVWDCDARSVADAVHAKLEHSDNVTAFAFSKRENKLAPKGIENMYDDEHLERFVTTATREVTGQSTRNMSGTDKADFSKYVMASGTKNYFKHYGQLVQVVQEILRKLTAV